MEIDFASRRKFIKNIKLGLKEACRNIFLSVYSTSKTYIMT